MESREFRMGTLTFVNAQEVVDRLLALLDRKVFTFVVAVESMGWRPRLFAHAPRVNVNQLLVGENPIRLKFVGEGKSRKATITISDTSGVRELSTSCEKDQGFDPDYVNPYIHFERRMEGDQVTITFRPPDGSVSRVYCVFAVQSG